MGLDGPAACIAAGGDQAQRLGNPGGSAARKRIHDLSGTDFGVLDVHVLDVAHDLRQELVSVVAVRDTVASVEEKTEGAPRRVEEQEHAIRPRPGPTDAILVEQDDPRPLRAPGQLTNTPHRPASPFGLVKSGVWVRHDPDVGAAEGAAPVEEDRQLIEIVREIPGNRSRPAPNLRGDAGHRHSPAPERIGNPDERPVIQASERLPVDGAQFDRVPAELGECVELVPQTGPCLIANPRIRDDRTLRTRPLSRDGCRRWGTDGDQTAPPAGGHVIIQGDVHLRSSAAPMPSATMACRWTTTIALGGTTAPSIPVSAAEISEIPTAFGLLVVRL